MEEKALRTVRVLYVAESNPLSGIKKIKIKFRLRIYLRIRGRLFLHSDFDAKPYGSLLHQLNEQTSHSWASANWV